MSGTEINSNPKSFTEFKENLTNALSSSAKSPCKISENNIIVLIFLVKKVNKNLPLCNSFYDKKDFLSFQCEAYHSSHKTEITQKISHNSTYILAESKLYD